MISRFKNIILIGTSHISPQSIKDVESTITEKKPEIVAIELDLKRFRAILSKKRKKLSLKDLKEMGFKGYLFNLLGMWIEKKLGKLTNTSPGSEMKKAIKLTQKNKSQLALIDQDVSITLSKISKRITWKEKKRFIKEIFFALFSKNTKIKFDITKVPPEKIITNITKELKNKYPSIHKTLILERDIYMANNLYKIATTHPKKKVVVVIGAGHIKGVLSHLKKQKWKNT